MFEVGDLVRKNPDTWVATDFDRWGAGDGFGVILAIEDADTVDVRWPNGRCWQNVNELLPVERGECA